MRPHGNNVWWFYYREQTQMREPISKAITERQMGSRDDEAVALPSSACEIPVRANYSEWHVQHIRTVWYYLAQSGDLKLYVPAIFSDFELSSDFI